MDGRKRVYHLTELKDRRRDLRQKSTEAEDILWEELRNNKLGVKFRRQFSVMGYVVDFYCPKRRLAIELLGSVHKTERAKKYDKYRKQYIGAFRITILEFWNSEVEKELSQVLASIKSHLISSPSP
jgi:Uncharacterized protein conserved in bacteria